MVLDLKKLKDVVNREVITSYDHRFLNHEVPPSTAWCTPENIAIDIWQRLQPHWPRMAGGCQPVRVYETPASVRRLLGEAACPRHAQVRHSRPLTGSTATGLSGRENAVLYGKCKRPIWPGDEPRSRSARGPARAALRRAIDPAALDRLVEEQVLRRLITSI